MKENTDKIKQAVTLITAITALVTAGTSLVKAIDKSVERASYETLSEKIVELQAEVVALKQPKPTNPSPTEVADAAMCEFPTDADQDGLKTDDLDPERITLPLPVASSAPSPQPKVVTVVAPTPPPSWAAIELKAQR